MFRMKKQLKSLNQRAVPHSKAKTRGTTLCQATLVSIFLFSVNIRSDY